MAGKPALAVRDFDRRILPRQIDGAIWRATPAIHVQTASESCSIGLGTEAAYGSLTMNKTIYSMVIAIAPIVWGACGGSYPAPAERLTAAQSAEQSARELGANSVPAAQLSLKLAQEQIADAKVAMADGQNQRAESLLIRAKADADLSIAQTRETGAKADTVEAVEESVEQQETNVGQGAVK